MVQNYNISSNYLYNLNNIKRQSTNPAMSLPVSSALPEKKEEKKNYSKWVMLAIGAVALGVLAFKRKNIAKFFKKEEETIAKETTKSPIKNNTAKTYSPTTSPASKRKDMGAKNPLINNHTNPQRKTPNTKTNMTQTPPPEKLRGNTTDETNINFLAWKTKGKFEQPKTTAVKDLPGYTTDAKTMTEQYKKTHRIEFNQKIPDGYRDGGRHTQFDTTGRAIGPNREIMIIDRKNDKTLNKTIEVFKNRLASKSGISEKEKMQELLKYMDEVFSVNKNVKALVDLTENFPADNIRLGDIIDSGAGVCRHRSLFAKIIADEIGLKMSLVRGKFGDGAHIWNEVQLNNSEKYIFDSMHKKIIDISNPELKAVRYATLYRGAITKTPLYLDYNSPVGLVYRTLTNLTENIPKNIGFAEFTKQKDGTILLKNTSSKSIKVNGTPIIGSISVKRGDKVEAAITKGTLEFEIP